MTPMAGEVRAGRSADNIMRQSIAGKAQDPAGRLLNIKATDRSSSERL